MPPPSAAALTRKAEAAAPEAARRREAPRESLPCRAEPPQRPLQQRSPPRTFRKADALARSNARRDRAVWRPGNRSEERSDNRKIITLPMVSNAIWPIRLGAPCEACRSAAPGTAPVRDDSVNQEERQVLPLRRNPSVRFRPPDAECQRLRMMPVSHTSSSERVQELPRQLDNAHVPGRLRGERKIHWPRSASPSTSSSVKMRVPFAGSSAALIMAFATTSPRISRYLRAIPMAFTAPRSTL